MSSGANGAPADPVAALDGSITYTFQLPAWFVATYSATATGASGTASVTFTDSPVKAFDQCANNMGSGYPATSADPGCQWINGNLQQSNSVYNEGDSTPQRLALTGLSTGTDLHPGVHLPDQQGRPARLRLPHDLQRLRDLDQRPVPGT
ncbi:MAG: hypothetical protein V9F04_16270 [Dermatophilaceae bacterium]